MEGGPAEPAASFKWLNNNVSDKSLSSVNLYLVFFFVIVYIPEIFKIIFLPINYF